MTFVSEGYQFKHQRCFIFSHRYEDLTVTSKNEKSNLACILKHFIYNNLGAFSEILYCFEWDISFPR